MCYEEDAAGFQLSIFLCYSSSSRQTSLDWNKRSLGLRVIVKISNGTRIVNDIYILKIFTPQHRSILYHTAGQNYQETYPLRLLENSKKIYLLKIRLTQVK